MPPSLHTLHSLSSATYNLPPNITTKVKSIPHLPSPDTAQNILHRLYLEFHPIAKARGYNVISLTEMCCCDDGWNHVPVSGKRRKKQVKPASDNVGGYNISFGRQASAIHLRLRRPRSHDFLTYDEIAGTMAHELAHCEIGPHSAEFYELMEDIERQRGEYLTKGLILDKDGFPMGDTGNNQRLGGAKKGGGDGRETRARAAEGRIGRVVGGSNGANVLGGTSLTKNPREAARIAAERRLADSKWCLPCHEVIEIFEDDEDTDNAIVIVDSGDDANNSSDCEIIEVVPSPSSRIKASKQKRCQRNNVSSTSSSSASPSKRNRQESLSWSCCRCTLENPNEIQLCVACGMERAISERDPSSNFVVTNDGRETTEKIKKKEIERSLRDFGGFNIYGTGAQKTGTMKHLT